MTGGGRGGGEQEQEKKKLKIEIVYPISTLIIQDTDKTEITINKMQKYMNISAE